MSEQSVFIMSERALAAVVAQVDDEQWDQLCPDWFQTGAQGKATLRQIVNYHAFDTAWVPDVLAGRTLAEVGRAHDHVKTDPGCDYQAYSDAAIAAAESLDDPDKLVHLSYGDFPAREYLKHITSFRGFRAYDIARWIGVSTVLPADVVQGMWDELVPEVEAWRVMGVYGDAVPVPEGSSLQDRLLGLVGRDPRATTTS